MRSEARNVFYYFLVKSIPSRPIIFRARYSVTFQISAHPASPYQNNYFL